eukprot:4511739-Pyramimonas_sp.AAC.1
MSEIIARVQPTVAGRLRGDPLAWRGCKPAARPRSSGLILADWFTLLEPVPHNYAPHAAT